VRAPVGQALWVKPPDSDEKTAAGRVRRLRTKREKARLPTCLESAERRCAVGPVHAVVSSCIPSQVTLRSSVAVAEGREAAPRRVAGTVRAPNGYVHQARRDVQKNAV